MSDDLDMIYGKLQLIRGDFSEDYTVRVVDVSAGISGAYCARLLGDAGASVVKAEPPGGSALRRQRGGRPDPTLTEDGALFRALHHGMQSFVVTCDGDLRGLIETADIVITSSVCDAARAREWCGEDPQLVWLSITPFGLTGPFANRPASDLTVQAEAGAPMSTGLPDGTPIASGGRVSEWVSGCYGAVAALAAARYAASSGYGERIDLSVCEAVKMACGVVRDHEYVVAGRPPLDVLRNFELPSVEPAGDGYVGFTTYTAEQLEGFLLMINRPDLIGEPWIATADTRFANAEAWNAIVHRWTRARTREEIVERASELRVPVAPVHDARTVQDFPHFVERNVFVSDATGTFRQPRRPWLVDGTPPPPPQPAPRLGSHEPLPTPLARRPARGARTLPLQGLRVLDTTAWWAGPICSGMLAALGADALHVESSKHIDGIRGTGARHGQEGAWWERSSHFITANANKRGITIELDTQEGRAVFDRLLVEADVLVENFTSRVFDRFGITAEHVHSVNPRCIFVRMPAFGLTGPWRDRSGFNTTMEQISGRALLTGEANDLPRVFRGPCDPIAGLHAAVATLDALERRDHAGRGSIVEVPMIESTLCVTEESIVEASAYDMLRQRGGNRATDAAPQGIYRCAGADEWLALTISDDHAWAACCRVLERSQWRDDPRFASQTAREAHHDELDSLLADELRGRDAQKTAEDLCAAEVPAGRAWDPRLTHNHPQLLARSFFESPDHPVIGEVPIDSQPFRFASVDQWLRRSAPLVGQHTDEALRDWIDLADDELDDLRARGVVGGEPSS